MVHKMPENIKEYDILKSANWQDLSYILKRHINTEMYKVVQGEESRLRHLFAVTNTRKGKMVEVLRPRTELGRNSLAFRGAVMWNVLDESLRNSQNINIFKTTLKKNIFKLNRITFAKGTCFNTNKDILNYYYFQAIFNVLRALILSLFTIYLIFTTLEIHGLFSFVFSFTIL